MKTWPVTLVTLLLTFVVNVTAHAQTCPTFPPRGIAIINQFLQSPANQTLAKGTDDQRRRLTKMIAEQMHFELGGWSIKSASPTRPASKDSLALPMTGTAFCNFDWQNGTTRQLALTAQSEGDYLTDQTLILTAGVNHLGAVTVPPVVVPEPEPPAPSLLIAQMAAAEAAIVELQGLLNAIRAENQRLQSEVQAQRDVLDHLVGVDATLQQNIDAVQSKIPTGCSVQFLGCRLR